MSTRCITPRGMSASGHRTNGGVWTLHQTAARPNESCGGMSGRTPKCGRLVNFGGLPRRHKRATSPHGQGQTPFRGRRAGAGGNRPAWASQSQSRRTVQRRPCWLCLFPRESGGLRRCGSCTEMLAAVRLCRVQPSSCLLASPPQPGRPSGHPLAECQVSAVGSIRIGDPLSYPLWARPLTWPQPDLSLRMQWRALKRRWTPSWSRLATSRS